MLFVIMSHKGTWELSKEPTRLFFWFPTGRVPSSMGIEGEDNDDDELQDDEFKDDDFDPDDRQGHDIDDFDDMEESNRYQPLKRRASTGTLLSQTRAQAVSVDENAPLHAQNPKVILCSVNVCSDTSCLTIRLNTFQVC